MPNTDTTAPFSQHLQTISDYIFTEKYSRYQDDKKRRETWDESIDRQVDMHLKKYFFLSNEDKDEIREAFNFVRDYRVVPSMRAMQFGGKAVEQANARLFNCLGKETRFVTSEGVKAFTDLKDGEEITVLTHLGNWKQAIVRNYGVQALNTITVGRGKNSFKVRATKNHRWILKNGEFIESLKGGEILLGAKNSFGEFDYDNAEPFEKLYWAYGYIYGDGTLVRSADTTYSMVRLCKKDQQYHKRFEELGFNTSTPLSLEGDFIAYTGKYLKTSPDPRTDSVELLRAFVRGYLDADGEKNSNTRTGSENLFLTIQSSSPDHIDFIKKVFPIVGAYIVSEQDLTGQKTDFGIRPKTSKIRICNTPHLENVPFKVQSIEENTAVEEVWCLEVEDDESFVLDNGLTTGNCAVRHVDSLRAFAEGFYLLLCGCGVTFGLNNDGYLGRLPNLVSAEDKNGVVLTYVVEDTIEGWANSVEALLMCYFKNTPYTGRKIVFDYSPIRRKGALLKTSGGKAPGYSGLKNAHQKIKALLDHIIENKGQERLLAVNAYDILMHCADAVLSGGIRRAATAIIFPETDEDMMNAKTTFVADKVFGFSETDSVVIGGYESKMFEGRVTVDGVRYDVKLNEYELNQLQTENTIAWYHIYPQRARSNNSVLLLRKETSLETFQNIINKTRQYGEPGFVFADHKDTLFNPCFEVGFIPVLPDGTCGVQFCNLTSQNGRFICSKEDFKKTTWASTVIGTLQAGYTKFPYLSPAAKQLTDEEALLGVSLTGVFDNPQIILDPDIQKEMAEYCLEVNAIWAKKLGINKAARTTLVKPEGTSSLVLGTGSGIHPHHAKRYFRRVQVNKMSPVYQFFKEKNPHMTEESIWSANKTDDVITFPIEVGEHTIVKADITALQHLDYIKSTQKNWVLPGTSKSNTKKCSHNVSCFSGDTRFLTKEGVKTFSEMVGRRTEVLGKDGLWKSAEIKSFGKQPTVLLNLKIQSGKSKRIKTIKTTKEHLWFSVQNKDSRKLPKISIKPTNELTEGDRLVHCFPSENIGYEKEGFLHGLVYGDGTLHQKRNECQIYLCDDSRHMSYLFEGTARSIIERDEIDQTRIYGLPNNWKTLPTSACTPEYLRAFIAGWFAADGSVGSNGTNLTLCCIDLEPLLWLRDTAIKAGISVLEPHERKTNETCFSKKDEFYVLSFVAKTLDEEFFIHNKKRNSFNSVSRTSQSPKRWTVETIEETGIIEEVYCAVVADGKAFVLEDNILTHNCTVICDENEWDDVINYLYENRDYFAAVSLLPKSGDKIYKQAPMEAVVTEEDEKRWDAILANLTLVDYKELKENTDNTAHNAEAACAGGKCDL